MKYTKKEETQILGSSNSHEKAAAGDAARSFSYIFQDVSGAVGALVGRVGSTSEDVTYDFINC